VRVLIWIQYRKAPVKADLMRKFEDGEEINSRDKRIKKSNEE